MSREISLGVFWDELPRRKPHLWRMREYYTEHGGSTLPEIICSTLRAAATDPRDKLFGILSLCTWDPMDHIIAADYAKSAAQVYSEATFSMLQRGNPYLHFPLRLRREACQSRYLDTRLRNLTPYRRKGERFGVV